MDIVVKNRKDKLINLAKEKKWSSHSIDVLERAFEYAFNKHNGQNRASGEPYIIHPIEVAIYLLSWDMDESTIIAGLLHDVIEDCLTEENEIARLFGHDVQNLVESISKVSNFSSKTRASILNNDGANSQNEYTIQVFLSMTKDLRAMIVKLADRLHNMNTIQFLNEQKQQKIANETLHIYANIAGRLGMYEVKTELLDKSFKILDKKSYNSTLTKIENLKIATDNLWKSTIKKICDLLDAHFIEYTISSRIKGIYSTYLKLSDAESIDEIHDIFAVRIIISDVLTCYKVLGLIHLNFIYLKGAFKDYISAPKFNLYQSIHTTIAIDKALFEVQIRTDQMNSFANIGVAAHWRYKEKKQAMNEAQLTVNNVLLRDFLNNKQRSVETLKSLTGIKLFDILLINKNEFMTVNAKTTIIDLAFKFDQTNLSHLKQALINGNDSSFDSLLSSGDSVKLVYDYSNEYIKPTWLNYANEYPTQQYIKEQFNSDKHNQYNLVKFVAYAKQQLGDKFLTESKAYTRIKKTFKIKSLSNWWLLITKNSSFIKESNLDLFVDLFNVNSNKFNDVCKYISNKSMTWKFHQYYLKDCEGIYFKDIVWSECCYKIPFCELIGILLRSNNLEVHKASCSKIAKFDNKKTKKIILDWDMDQIIKSVKKWPVKILLRGTWTESIGNRLATIASNYNGAITKLEINRNKINNTYEGIVEMYVRSEKVLTNIILDYKDQGYINEYKIY